MVRDSLQRVRIAVFLFWSWRPDKITGLIRFLSIWVIYKTMPGGLPALLRADYSVFLLDAARNTSYLFNKKVKGAKSEKFSMMKWNRSKVKECVFPACVRQWPDAAAVLLFLSGTWCNTWCKHKSQPLLRSQEFPQLSQLWLKYTEIDGSFLFIRCCFCPP